MVVLSSKENGTVRPQRTLAREVEFRGAGLHTGREVRAILKPAEAGTGIEFVRNDLAGEPTVRASGAYLKTRERRTCLHHGQAEVFTVEHLLAALWAMRIDNVEVHVDGEEIPGMDGSAREFVEAIRAAGVTEQKATRSRYAIREPIHVREGSASVVGRKSPDSLYSERHVTFEDDAGAYDQKDAAGFIKLNALRLRLLAQRDQR